MPDDVPGSSLGMERQIQTYTAGERDLSVRLFGKRLNYPLLLAPIGVLSIVHEEGEVAVARAARSLGLAGCRISRMSQAVCSPIQLRLTK